MLTIDSAVTLKSGVAMPRLGLGVWKSARGAETYDAVRVAIDAGYRHVDTAKIYGNEADVGRAVREHGRVPREQVFVTTKLWHADHGYDRARRAFDESLRTLGLDYVDLYLIHWPEGDRRGSWRALKEILREGRARAIGVSNYTVDHLREMQDDDVPPSVNQVELHPLLTQPELVSHCRAHDVRIEAYSPLMHGQNMDHPTIARIATEVAKTPAQVLIRWSLQHDFVVIPKSVREARIRENAAVFDFALTSEQMRALDAMNQGTRTSWDPTSIA